MSAKTEEKLNNNLLSSNIQMPDKKSEQVEDANGTETQRRPLHVCVVGAGICGIAAIKACLDEGLQVSCYERSSTYGGLWRYKPDTAQSDGHFEPSVMRTTILNTSKELSAFSDFPPLAQLPNFMRHNLYMDYIDSYVRRFDLERHMNFKHEIVHCEPRWITSDGHATIKWLVKMRKLNETDDNSSKQAIGFELSFDRLMVAIGHHNIPYMPKCGGQEKFRGELIHSARLKNIIGSERFVDKRALVVGIGNSACDAANDISLLASKCYVSTHRGQWFTSRYLADGPYERRVKTRVYNQLAKVLPKSFVDHLTIGRLERRTNHRMLGLEPKHAPSEQVPAINDLFPYKIYTGGVVLKGAIKSFTERGVIFEGEEDTEYEVDIVVFATGYEARVAFMDELALGLRSVSSNQNKHEYELFLNIFAPKLNVPLTQKDDSNNVSQQQEPRQQQQQQQKQLQSIAQSSFAFIGLVQPNGSLTVISELQSRYAARVLAGKQALPSNKVMLAHMDRMRRMRACAVRSHSRDQIIGNYVDYTDTIARLLGVKPNMASLFFKDFPLWKQLEFGPSVAYQYRLGGPGKWSEARETIMKVNERIYCGINEGKNHLLYKSRRKRLTDQRS